jgi:hypothetical protein
MFLLFICNIVLYLQVELKKGNEQWKTKRQYQLKMVIDQTL